jgi:XTP/dITP diphosphohydrolase
MKLLVATRNVDKLEEIKAIFTLPSLEYVTVADLPGLPEVVEDKESFEENAAKKAVTLAKASGLWAIADDSGLEVDALDGRPGIYSARYAGEPPDYLANNEKLLRELGERDDREARFRCAVALSDPVGQVRVLEEVCEGRIIKSSRGEHGFGYDPLFVPDGYEETFAEMDGSLKNSISHRARAFQSARTAWEEVLVRL